MTTDQWMAALRTGLQILGTVLTMLGYVTAESWGTFTALALQAVGPALMLGTFMWTMFSRSKIATVQSASVLPEVKEMKITDPVLAQAAAAADPRTIVTTATGKRI